MIVEEDFKKICEEVGLRRASACYDVSEYWYMYGTAEIAEYSNDSNKGIVVMDFTIDGAGALSENWPSREYCKTTEELRETLIASMKRYKEMMKTIRKHKIDEI